MVKRWLVVLGLAALMAAALGGCAPAKQATLVGEWLSPDSAGMKANLSDLTLFADGRFRYAGKNALGGPVAFGGTYQTGVDGGAAWIKLTYSDFPDKPRLWYYALDGEKLTVSEARGNLTNGSGLVFLRKSRG